ncbi:HNH endonuclease signature motif containing protein [Arthrobacter cavernae]|uniref:HNH endonuclease n=1 Tax=Arthrobacter cavernae TaxID=2817681 RepID=A0A939HA25_9MICC|nr:HNH endonuclease signature motif containing protein [Arthrobacter cavernae]MBO1267077.1 HNH endonuclease [Arthrobacter cavernae]
MTNTGESNTQLAPDQIAWLKGLKMPRRAGIVRDHILTHGAVTTTTLRDTYGYDHPPRAAGDLKDAGAGVEKRMVTINGKRMAEYFFTGAANKNAIGRVVIPKKFADGLKAAYGNQCAICSGEYSARELQADHRVPFAIGGDKPVMAYEDFMPLCGSDNMAKGQSCKVCPNWTIKDVGTCEGCYWAHPENYSHVATRPERRLTVTFQGVETISYDKLKVTAGETGVDVEELAKTVLTGE